MAGADVRVEATLNTRGDTSWAVLAQGATGLDGSFRFEAPGQSASRHYTVRRIVVTKDADAAVFDATRPPDRYADNQWSKSRDTWLQWTVEPLTGRGVAATVVAHLFTERPVYRHAEGRPGAAEFVEVPV